MYKTNDIDPQRLDKAGLRMNPYVTPNNKFI